MLILRGPRFSSLVVPALAVCLLVPWRGVAGATVLDAMDFASQCGSAARIFVGAVQAVESRRNPAAPRYFETFVTFAVDETVAGEGAPEVRLRFTGGKVGDERQAIDGMPEFTVGERYVVLADDAGAAPSISPIIGFNQGLYRVVAAEGARSRPLVRDRLGNPLREAWPAAGVGIPDALRTEAATDEVELGTFIRAIRANRR